MEPEEIDYVYKGGRHKVQAHLLSPLSWIFLISSTDFDPFHLEYDEIRRKWLPIEQSVDTKLVSAISCELMKLYRKDIERTVSGTKFSSLDFFVIDNGREDIICFWDRELRIRVIPLTDSPLYQDRKELLYYGDDFGTPIAFQTIDYDGEDTEIILQAIKWYAQYLDYPQMVVSEENPLSC